MTASIDCDALIAKESRSLGGGSVGTWTLKDGYGFWEGGVVNVTFLGAPGFCAVETTADLATIDASAYLAKASWCSGFRDPITTLAPRDSSAHLSTTLAVRGPSHKQETRHLSREFLTFVTVATRCDSLVTRVASRKCDTSWPV